MGFYTKLLSLLLGVIAVLAGVTAYLNWQVGIAAGVVFLVLLILVLANGYRTKKALYQFLDGISETLSTTQRKVLREFPMPVLVVDDGKVVWYNSACEERAFEGEKIFELDIQQLIPSASFDAPCPKEGVPASYGEHLFTAFWIKPDSLDQKMTVVYLVEDTQLKRAAKEYVETRPSVMLITIDSYEDLLSDLKESERSRIVGQVEDLIYQYVENYHVLMRQTSRDQFLLVLEERHMRDMVQNRFRILDQVRAMETPGGVAPTLSIGVGRNVSSLSEGEQMARQALDMALGRGGDQAAIKTLNGFEFYGGVSKGVEKRTKVKTRIVANALKELLEGSDNVLLMGHHFADLDCFGAAVGMMKAVRLLGKPAAIVIDRKKNLVGPLLQRLLQTEGYSEGDFLNPDDAMERIGKKTTLIVVDTHVPFFLESPQVYEACKTVVVIDHHRKMVGHIDNAVIFYHEPYASSASEMVAELVQYFGASKPLGRPEAEALLAGIMLDTKNFVMKTGVRTFEAAAYLRRMGADTVSVKKLFSSDMETYQIRTHIVSSAEVYRSCAIATCSVHSDCIQIAAPQAADELLGINEVKASIVLYEVNHGISFSARSMGEINVQLIMEKLGGGGHLTMAGAQLPGCTMEEAKEKLTRAIDEYLDSLQQQ